MKKNEKALEKIYQKKTPLEHILLRPDSYVGSIEMQKDKLWVFNKETQKLEFKDINYCPGLYKIFDEIIVNAADNYQSNISLIFRRSHYDFYKSNNRPGKQQNLC
jgi:DNA topoisomerase-2